jgi:hypothetical protein
MIAMCNFAPAHAGTAVPLALFSNGVFMHGKDFWSGNIKKVCQQGMVAMYIRQIHSHRLCFTSLKYVFQILEVCFPKVCWVVGHLLTCSLLCCLAWPHFVGPAGPTAVVVRDALHHPPPFRYYAQHILQHA